MWGKPATIIAFALLAGAVLVDGRLTRGGFTRSTLLDHYSVNPAVFQVDFDRDGLTDDFRIEKDTLTISSGGRTLVQIPYRRIDGTLRTHLALRYEHREPRLLIFDAASGREHKRYVFAPEGARLIEAQPTRWDEEVLDALAASDDGGTGNQLAFYSFLPDAHSADSRSTCGLSVLPRKESKPNSKLQT